jgi:uridine kinase
MHEIVETEWKKINAEMKPNGVIIIYGIFHVSNTSMNEE